jgi:Fe-S-cluster containining protein
MKSGDCCRHIGAVVMMPAERAELERASDRPMVFTDLADGKVALQPTPGTDTCPLLSESGDCTVHAVRPYNCRRWGCFRPTTDEPFVMAVRPDGEPYRKFTLRPVARQLARMQRHAQPWALAHGWVPEE